MVYPQPWLLPVEKERLRWLWRCRWLSSAVAPNCGVEGNSDGSGGVGARSQVLLVEGAPCLQ